MSRDKVKTDAAPQKAGGKMKKMLLIGIAVLVLIGAGIGGGLYASGKLGTEKTKVEDPNRPKLVERSEEATQASEGEEGKEPPLKVGTVSVKNDTVKVDPAKYETTYVPLDQSFTANLADGAGFVQIGLSVSTYYDGKVISNIKRESVPIRSAILMVLSEQDAAVLSTPEGKHTLQKRLTRAINTVLREKVGFGGIDNVYFTNLVIQ
jgi:flagellar protein FliL